MFPYLPLYHTHLGVGVSRLDGLGGYLGRVVRRQHHVGLGASDGGCWVDPHLEMMKGGIMNV